MSNLTGAKNRAVDNIIPDGTSFLFSEIPDVFISTYFYYFYNSLI